MHRPTKSFFTIMIFFFFLSFQLLSIAFHCDCALHLLSEEGLLCALKGPTASNADSAVAYPIRHNLNIHYVERQQSQ